MLCGTPGTGIHSTRLFGLAFWDMLLTVVFAILVNRWVFDGKHFAGVLVAMVLLGIGVHRALGINTKLNQIIFGNNT